MKQINLIAISGKIGSGKNTVATIWQLICTHKLYSSQPFDIREVYSDYKLYNEKEIQGNCRDWETFIQKSFGEKLKMICAILIGEPDVSKFGNAYYKSSKLPTEWNNPEPLTVRKMLQIVGTEAMRDNFHPNVWVNALFADYTPESKWIITDMRFPNEFEAVKQKGGLCIRVNRDACEKSDHLSETALDNHQFDFTIDNNGTIEQLIDAVYEVFKQIP